MPSIIVLCVLALACWLPALPALGQGKSSARIAIEVRGDEPNETCLTAEQLGSRIAFYSTRKALPRGMQLVLRLSARDVAELQILRDGQVVSRRVFEHLPGPCADRRDAVALSIALAIEHAASTEASAAVAAEPGSSTVSGVSATQTGSGEGASASEEPEPAQQQTEQVTQSTPQPRAAEPADEAEEEEAEEEEDTGPIVLGTMPTTTSRDPRRGDRPSLFQLHLGGRFVLEALPFPVWAGALGLELALSKRVSLDVSAVLSSIGEAPLAGGFARASMLGLEAVGCGSFPISVFMLQACVGASVALCGVSGRNFPRTRPDDTLLWAAAVARVALRWPQESSVALRLFVQPHVSFSPLELQVQGSSERLRTSLVGGLAGLDLWLALP